MSFDNCPSGSSGLILGEIFGRNAGLTSVELVLFLFRELRFLESLLIPATEGDGNICGMGVALGIGVAAAEPSLGSMRGVGLPSCGASLGVAFLEP